MQVFIYHGGSDSDRDLQIRADFAFNEYYSIIQTAEKSLKIEEVRALQNSLATTFPKKRLVYFPQANLLTLAAQNALLKTLEEPPLDTTFVLSVANLDQLISTIRSRAVLLKVKPSVSLRDDYPLKLTKSLLIASMGERLTLVDQVGKDRTTAVAFITSLLTELHHKIGTVTNHKQLLTLTQIARAASRAYLGLNANVSVGLAMREFALSLPRSSPPARMG